MAHDGCVSMTRTWGFLATDVPDPPECVLSCRRDFLRGLTLEHETLDIVCEALSDTTATNPVSVSESVLPAPAAAAAAAAAAGSTTTSTFWALYCCDAQRCGVDNLRRGGQDPNVNWFINSCQNIGHSFINDPGPPGQAYSCDGIISDQSDTITRCDYQAGYSDSDSMPTATTRTSITTQTHLTIHDPSLEATSDPTQSDSNSSSSSSSSDNSNTDVDDGLSTGVKVTMALATLAALLVLVLAVAALVRYRAGRPPHRRNLGRYLRAGYHKLYPSSSSSPSPAGRLPSTPPPPPSPAQHLLSSTLPQTDRDGVPLTPPPRLKERRLLSDAHPTPPKATSAYHRHHPKGHGHDYARDFSASGQTLLVSGLPAVPRSALHPPDRGSLNRRSALPKTSSKSGPLVPPPALAAASRSPITSTSTITAPLSPPTSPYGWTDSQRRSVSSSRPTTTTSTSSSTAALIRGGGGPSKTASPGPYANRSRVATLDLAAGLRSPGPPPTKALPSTPPNSLVGSPSLSSSPSWLQTSTSPPRPPVPGDIGVAVGLVSRNPAAGIVLDRESRDLCHLTEWDHRERQRMTAAGNGEWWTTGGSGSGSVGRRTYNGGSAAPPAATAHRSTGSVRVGSPVLEEVDLERMAGGY